MLKNAIKIAIRNLRRHAGYSLINISGLTIGISCCLLITLYIKDELSFDHYNKNLDRTYRILHAFTPVRPLQPADYQVWGSSPVGELIKLEFPEVDKVAQFSSKGGYLFQNGDIRIQENEVFFADSTVFDIFSWNMIEGEPAKALVAPYTMVLTESAAQRYFGDQSALGKSLLVDNGSTYQITGMIEDIPQNSQIRFDALLSSTTWRQQRPDDFKYWGYVDFYTYFTVNKDFNADDFMAKVPAFLKRHAADAGKEYTFKIEPAADAYLKSKAVRQPGPTGSLSSLYTFGTIAVFILVIACINFMNLSTARSMDRAKEVGVRKLVGAKRGALMRQFLAESLLLSFIATTIAFAVTSMLLPGFQLVSDKVFPFESLLQPDILLGLALAVIVVGLMAGIYPALVLSRFMPAVVLKGIFKNSASGTLLRKSLVVFQFGISVVLIIGALIVFNQLEYMQHLDKGFTADQMLIIDFGGDEKARNELNIIKDVIQQIPGVKSTSAQRTVPGGFFPKAYTEIEGADGTMEGKGPDLYEVDYDFISNFGIQIVAGRAYSRDFITDSTKAMVINEAAARDWGYRNPKDIIGKKFSQWGKEGMIIGVVKDFNYLSLHTNIQPLTLRLTPVWAPNSIAVRMSPNEAKSIIEKLGKVWIEYVPQRPFLYTFMDEAFNRQYRSDLNFGKLVNIFTGLAIFIASIGLFGLTTYVTEQRTREIGIRKVLGASVTSLVSLLSRDFLKLILLAVIISIPAAQYVMDKWLNGFAYRITPGPMTYLIPGAVVIAVALMVIATQSIRTSMTDPVKSLRND